MLYRYTVRLCTIWHTSARVAAVPCVLVDGSASFKVARELCRHACRHVGQNAPALTFGGQAPHQPRPPVLHHSLTPHPTPFLPAPARPQQFDMVLSSDRTTTAGQLLMFQTTSNKLYITFRLFCPYALRPGVSIEVPFSMGVYAWNTTDPAASPQYADPFPITSGIYTCMSLILDLANICNPERSAFMFTPTALANHGCGCFPTSRPCPPADLSLNMPLIIQPSLYMVPSMDRCRPGPTVQRFIAATDDGTGTIQWDTSLCVTPPPPDDETRGGQLPDTPPPNTPPVPPVPYPSPRPIPSPSPETSALPDIPRPSTIPPPVTSNATDPSPFSTPTPPPAPTPDASPAPPPVPPSTPPPTGFPIASPTPTPTPSPTTDSGGGDSGGKDDTAPQPSSVPLPAPPPDTIVQASSSPSAPAFIQTRMGTGVLGAGVAVAVLLIGGLAVAGFVRYRRRRAAGGGNGGDGGPGGGLKAIARSSAPAMSDNASFYDDQSLTNLSFAMMPHVYEREENRSRAGSGGSGDALMTVGDAFPHDLDGGDHSLGPGDMEKGGTYSAKLFPLSIESSSLSGTTNTTTLSAQGGLGSRPHSGTYGAFGHSGGSEVRAL